MRPKKSRAPQKYGTAHEAFARLIDALGGFEAAATRCDRSKTMLHNYANPNEPDRTVPLHIAVDLESHSNEKPITEFLAAAANKLVIDIPASAAPPQSWINHIARISEEFSDVVRKTGEFLKNDDDIDAIEASKLLKEIDEFLVVLGDMRVAVEARSEETDRSVA